MIKCQSIHFYIIAHNDEASFPYLPALAIQVVGIEITRSYRFPDNEEIMARIQEMAPVNTCCLKNIHDYSKVVIKVG